MAPDDKSLLIYAPVPLYDTEEGLMLEDQACNGLRLWAENFESVTAMLPVIQGDPPQSWRPIETVGENLSRIRILPLPTAYRPDQFLRHYRTTRDLIRAEIEQADYLSFSIGGLFGDWGSVACLQAHRMGRPFAVWTDRVESEVVRRTAGSADRWRRRLRARLEHRPMAWFERHVIRRAGLGLFHGKETFDTYAPHCPNPVVVHDIHIKKADHIAPEALQAKIEAAGQGPLRVGYVGRADAMKGPLDWVGALKGLAEAGAEFRAFWLGEGPDLPRMREALERAGLLEQVSLLGFVDDRAKVLAHLREAQVFLFCHKTPESPRCLIEALISGTPIIGYDGSFARDLISDHGGGRLVKLGDVAGLTAALAELAGDRDALKALIAAAAADGAPYDDESVFRHRSEMIRQHLAAPVREAEPAG